jgi:glucan biosynthesis protein
MTSFQAYGTQQGRQFAEQCDGLLVSRGYSLQTNLVLPEVGVEIDRVAVAPSGRTVWFEYKGSVQGARPGLMRTDTLKKAIANGALLQRLVERPPYIVLTSHLPNSGAGFAMLETALELQYFDDVICVYDPTQTGRLAAV